MHFSIPDTQELIDKAGNPYLGYNMHINGLYHCTVRYKQLHNLHEHLVKEIDFPLPAFPPKKLFPLTVKQREERRLCLDKYIQTIGQNTSINSLELLNGFLLSAQLESATYSTEEENISVFLMNGTKVHINVVLAENSGQIFKKICKEIKLDEKFHPYFSLFIVLKNADNFFVLRKLQDFESPVIAKKNIHKIESRIVLGKWYWDTAFDSELLEDPVALNLLYIQAAAEVERGWIPVTKEIKQRLKSLQDKNQIEAYLEIVRALKYYGCMQFAPCVCDYPQPGTEVIVTIGKNELNIRIPAEDGQEEITFKVTRMRCWRIITLREENEKCEESSEYKLEISFEYLMAKDHLQWITISSEQAVLMSVCLQSMIDEMLSKSVGGTKKPEATGKPWTYITRDGYTRTFIGSFSSEKADKILMESDKKTKTEPIMKKLTERFSAVVRKPSKSSIPQQEKRISVDGDLLENNAFCMIGDDDL